MDALIDRLRVIPHLTLPVTFDLQAMQSELSCIDEFLPYHSVAAEAREKMRMSFFGRSLIAPNGDSRAGLSEMDLFRMKVTPTELAAQMPVTMAAIQFMGAETYRSSIMLIPSGKSLYWHAHIKQPLHVMTVQIPLVMPANFWYEVTPERNLVGPILPAVGRQQIADDALVFRANYPAGKPTIFNSYHFHNVFNRGPAGRITILLYCNLELSRFRQLVVDAIDSYSGPLIPL